MDIFIRFTRDENIRHYNADEMDIDIEEYVWGVVGAEIGNSSVEACKALAIAARTNAVGAGKVSDKNPQAFRAGRLTDAYQNARQGMKDTAGWVLYHDGKIANPASYSSNNGGRTKSSKEKWGSYRPWLIEQDDPWDKAGGCASKPSHSVGLSQAGAKYAAKIGKTYKDILAFYYPTTYLHNLYTNEDMQFHMEASEQQKESDTMSAKASDYLVTARAIEAEKSKWKYVRGKSQKYQADCAGLVKYILEKHGVLSYDGSNTQWRKYTTSMKGKIGTIKLQPGMLCFKHRAWSSSQSGNPYYGDSIGDMYHVGMLLDDTHVLEARGTNSGIVVSDVSAWHYAAQHINTVLDVDGDQSFVPFTGIVQTQSGNLNLRSQPNGTKTDSIPKGTILTITDKYGNWYETSYNGKTGWVSGDYIVAVSESDVKKTKDYTIYGVSEDFWTEFEQYLTAHKLAFSSKGGV